MNKMEFREFVKKNRWTYAKTYALFAPHEYVNRSRSNSTYEEFISACQYILDNGIRMFYYKNERKYLFLDGYFYWLMVNEADDKATIINRCKPEDYDIVFMRRGTQAGKSARVEPKYTQMAFDFGD